MPQTKKFSQGADHAGGAGIVPGDFEQALAVVIGLGHPDVIDATRTLDIGQEAGLSGRKGPGIGVATAGIPGGNAVGFCAVVGC